MRLSLCSVSLFWATFVAGPLSICFVVAPAVAQQGLPPGGARPPIGAPPAAAAPAPSAPAAAGTSVAVIDVAYIFKNHVRFNQQMEQMKGDIGAFDAHMQEESKKLQKKQEEMASFAPSSPQFKKADEELAKMKSDFQITVQSKKRDFLEQEAKVYFQIYKEVEDSVAEFAQRNGIRLVLRFTGDDMKADDRASVLQGVNKPVVYQYQLDITLNILNKLNAGATMPSQSPAGTISRPPGPTVPTAPNRPITR